MIGWSNWLRALSSTLLVAALGCSGSSDGGAGNTSGDGGGGSGGVDPNPTPSGSVDVALAEGAGWTFSFFRRRTQSAGGSGSSSEAAGIFRVALGAPVTIETETAYPATLEVLDGDPEEVEGILRWTHLATDGNGALLGSLDGASLRPVYRADGSGGVGEGFFADFGSDPEILASSATFEGRYSTLQALRAAESTSDDKCRTILGRTFCGDESNSFRQSEHFTAGVGPIAYEVFTSSFDEGGMFGTTFSSELEVEVISTTFALPGGGTVGSPWALLAPLPEPASRPGVAPLGDRLYAFDPANGVAAYDPVEDRWEARRSLPSDITEVYAAASAGGRVVLFADDQSVVEACQVRPWVYDAGANTLTPGTQAAAPNCLGDSRFAATMEPGLEGVPDELAVVMDGGNSPVERFFFGYDPLGDTWYQISGELLDPIDGVRSTDVFGDPLQSYCELAAADSRVFTTYHVLETSGSTNFRTDATYLFDASANVLTRFGTGPLNTSLSDCFDPIVFDGARLYRFRASVDGDPDPGSVIDLDTSTEEELPLNLVPRAGFRAVQLGRSIYLVGGALDGSPVATVERLDLE